MAFDKSVYPVLPEMLDDDDDEIVREVKLWSLVTAQEEQERRERLNRELSLAGRPSDPNLRSFLTLQESSSLPELVGGVGVDISSATVERSPAKAAVYSQIARPRPHSGRSHGVETGAPTIPRPGTGPSSGTVVPPPLPAVPPNARSRMQADVVRIPSPPQNAPRNRKEIPPRARDTSANRSQSLSPPFHRTNLTSCSIPDDIPSSSHDEPLICLSPPTKPERVDDFDLKSLDPLRTPSSGLRNSPLTKTISDPVAQNLYRLSADPKVPPYRNSPVPTPADGSHLPSSSAAGNDAAGGCPVVYGFSPLVTSDLFSPSSPGFPVTWLHDSTGNVPVSCAAGRETARRSAHTGSVSSMGSDLMDFSTTDEFYQLDPVYMDLADFDPLFTVDSKAWNFEHRFDSDEIFGKTGTAPSRSGRNSAARSTASEQPPAPLPDVVAQSSVSRLASVDELQDPFSVQDLMVSLEKKRQKHAREQEAHESSDVNRQRPQATNDASSATASPSKRKVLRFLLLFNLFHAGVMPNTSQCQITR